MITNFSWLLSVSVKFSSVTLCIELASLLVAVCSFAYAVHSYDTSHFLTHYKNCCFCPLEKVIAMLVYVACQLYSQCFSVLSSQDFLHEMSHKDDKIDSLVKMGFPEDEAALAITRCGVLSEPLFHAPLFAFRFIL